MVTIDWRGMVNGTRNASKPLANRLLPRSGGKAVFVFYNNNTLTVVPLTASDTGYVTLGTATNVGSSTVTTYDPTDMQAARIGADGTGDLYVATYPKRVAYDSGPPLLEACVFHVTPDGTTSFRQAISLEGRQRVNAFNNYACRIAGDGVTTGAMMLRAANATGGGVVQTLSASGGVLALGAETPVPLERDIDTNTFAKRNFLGLYVGHGYSVLDLTVEYYYAWSAMYGSYTANGVKGADKRPMMAFTGAGGLIGDVTMQLNEGYIWPEDTLAHCAAHPTTQNRVYVELELPDVATGEAEARLAEIDLSPGNAVVRRYVQLERRKGGAGYPVVATSRGINYLTTGFPTAYATTMSVTLDAFGTPITDAAGQYQFKYNGVQMSTSASLGYQDGLVPGTDGYFTLVTADGRPWLGYAYSPPPPGKDMNLAAVAPKATGYFDLNGLEGGLKAVTRAFVGT